MSGLLVGLLAFLFACVFIVAFLRGAHSDDDNAIGAEAAYPRDEWRFECDEVTGLSKEEAAQVKSFLSRRGDGFKSSVKELSRAD